MDFFDMTKKFERKFIPPGETDGYRDYGEEDDCDTYSYRSAAPVIKGKEYVKAYKEKELKELREMESQVQAMNLVGNDGEELTSIGTMRNIHEINREELTQVYHKYDFDYQPPKNLTIHSYQPKILSVTETNPVTIIVGPTGCGKTTQVPQYILNHYAQKNIHCNIVVTQPRRIAAISIAKRVCSERVDWELGGICGYKIGLKGVVSPDTRLQYVTVGVLLQMLINRRDMNEFTHVIIDEVHERNKDTDFLLIIVKKLLHSHSRNVKVILMSATVDAAKFARYFQTSNCGVLSPAPVIDIQAETNFKVYKHYLEDLAQLGPLPEITLDDPKISEESIRICLHLIKMLDVFDQNKKKKSVLIFLPGIYEIDELYKRLNDPSVYSPPNSNKSYKWYVFPLHSTITEKEQSDVFKLPPADCRKIILATNIAESSITVPDVKYVIDFCLTKVLVHDYQSNFSSLQVVWASKANCVQRAGRVGRVMDGRVYRMVPRNFYEELNEETIPEILRSPLDKLVLQSKLLKMGEPKAVLAVALDPPDLTNIERTILLLKEVGGLLTTCEGRVSAVDGDITFLGRMMAKLPVDICVTKLIMLGYVFSVLPECVVMGAAMSLKNMFSTPFQAHLKAYNSKLDWADGTCSDCIAFLNVYDVYVRNKRDGYFNRSVGSGESGWAKRHFIQLRALKEVELLVEELTRRLKMHTIEELACQGRVRWNEFEKAFVLKFVLGGAFYPNYFGRGQRGGQINEEDAVKTISGRDPFNTVYLQGLPADQPGQLYSQLIHDALEDCNQDMKITCDDGSPKIFVEFRDGERDENNELPFDSKIPGKISMAVYRAIKIRHVRHNIIIRVLPSHEAQRRAKKYGVATRTHEPFTTSRLDQDPDDEDGDSGVGVDSVVPGVNVQHVELLIQSIIDPGHFWAVYSHARVNQQLVFIQHTLNSCRLNDLDDLPEFNKVYAVQSLDKNLKSPKYYRGKVEYISVPKNVATVHFIDYGNTEPVPLTAIKDVNASTRTELAAIPGQAMECRLCCIKPSMFENPKGDWTREAHELFNDLVRNSSQCFGKIYSVVNSVVYLNLYLLYDEQQINVNDKLVEMGFGVMAEESYLSKLNHDIRSNQVDPEQVQYLDTKQIGKKWNNLVSVPPPDPDECKQIVQLRGPHSPLEMKLFGYTREAMNRQITLARDSVNSVLLDSDPQDPHERLLVAAHTGQNHDGSSLNLRYNTLMPNIHGLPGLLCLLFSPRAELRVNKTRTQYTGVLCGLGGDNRGRGIFPERQIELEFDTVVSQEDVGDINFIRFSMSILLYTEEGEELPQNSVHDIVRAQNDIKRVLIKLMKRQRSSQQITFEKNQHKWMLIEPDIVPADTISDYQSRLIYPLHGAYTLKRESTDKNEQLKKNIQLLHELNKIGSKSIQEVECKLCSESITSRQELRLHLCSMRHKTLEQKIMTNEQYSSSS